MLTEQGIITKTEGNKAWVMVKRTNMCESCKSKKACFTLANNRDVECETTNAIGAQVGDRVLVKISSGSLLKASFVIYLVPVLAVVLGAALGQYLAARLGIDPELSSLLFSVAACGLAFLIIRVFAASVRSKQDYTPEIIKVYVEK